MSRKPELIALLVTGVVAIAGAVILFIGWTELSESIASSSWPTTEGVIETVNVERSTRKDSEGRYKYTPQVNYSYQVNGVTFQSHRIGPPVFTTDSDSDARRVIAPYSGKRNVTVYYSPSDPSRALLEPGLAWGSVFIPGLGGCFAVLGGLGFLGFLRGLFQRPR